MFLPLTTAAAFAPYALPNSTSTLYRRSDSLQPSGTASSSANLTISVNGECSGSQTCLGSQYGDSCSKWGYCGPSNDTAYSGPGCMSQFGVCSSSNSTIGTNSSTSAVPTFGNTTITTSMSQPTGNSSSSSMNISMTASSAIASTSTLSTSMVSTATMAPSYTYAPASSTQSSSSASPSGTSESAAASSQYNMFLGTGSTSDGWPEQSKWKSFDTLFEMNRQIMADSCAQFNVPNNTDSEINDIKSAIQTVSKASGSDASFILVIMLQESNGCVRSPQTSLSVANPGLMQSYMGSAKCNSGPADAPADVLTPCPASTIHDMIDQGTTGTVPGGMSLTYALKQSGSQDVSKYYKAARIYNSGSIASSGLLQDGVATHCYASDVANRLLGWSLGPSGCTLNSS